MNKFSFAILCVAAFAVSAFSQASTGIRPRVAPTPVAPAPVIKNDAPQSTDRRPPVVAGESRDTTPAAGAKPSEDSGDVIKVETNLVTLPVSVLDREGRFVSGLQQKDFRIFENGIEQKVDYFQSVEQPFTVILMIDVSPSTQYKIDEIHDAAITFVNQLRSSDKVMVIAFDDQVRVLCEPTNNRNRLRDAIYEAQFGDGTSLYEAVDFAVNRELKRIEGRKAIVLFTDGVDTTSRRANYQSTIADIQELDALIYPIRFNTQPRGFGGGGSSGVYGGQRRRRGGFGDMVGIILGGGQIPMGGGMGGAGSSPEEYELGKQYLETLAKNSGGRMFEDNNNLDAAFSGIAEELRQQYSLGYYPDNVGQKGDRKQMKVRVMRPNLIVRAKSSYIVGENGVRVAGK
ncbi:MAG: VWA domain-containing protein [Pyrinomonadaceae bacterium]